MAQLGLRERLQPALLDRLIDDERVLTCYEFEFRRAELVRLGISERDLLGILTAQGLRSLDELSSGAASDAETLRLTLFAAGGLVSLSHLKSLVLKPAGNPKGLALQSFCTVTARNVMNTMAESGDLRAVSSRRLRDYVCRDVAALLNCANLEAVTDLGAYPEVQSSVLNFGMPSLAGRAARSADPQQIAAAIAAAIRRFEPRLSGIRVTPEMGQEGNETHVLAFRVEALLWGQVTSQQLVLRTSVDVDSGNVSIADSGVS